MFSTLVSLGAKVLPVATNPASKVLPGLATGALSNLGNFGMDKILGQGWYQNTSQRGGFLILPNKIEYIQKSFNQKTEIADSCSFFSIWWTGTLLASIGVSLLSNARTGKGMQNRPTQSMLRTLLPRSQPSTSTSNQGGNGLQNRP